MRRSLTGAGGDVSAALLAHLNAERAYWMVELVSFQFVTIGTGNPPTLTLRWASSWVDVPYGADVYSARGPLVNREQIRTVRGTEADTLDLELVCGDVTLPAPHQALTLSAALAAGLGDGAVVTVRRAFLPGPWVPNVPPNTNTLGAVTLFLGRVSEKEVTRSVAKLRVTSFLEQLNVAIPRGIFQPGCQNTLGDAVCGVDLTPMVHTTTLNKIGVGGAFGLTSPAPLGFPLGVCEFTTGTLRGLRTSIKRTSGNGTLIYLLYGLKILPAPGDGVVLYPGCDKTVSTCGAKFNNVERYRGFPHIPPPENAL